MGGVTSQPALFDSALALMRAADALTGVRPTMPPDEIRRRQDVSKDVLEVRYLISCFRATKVSAERAEYRIRMDALVAQNGSLKDEINQGLGDRVSMTAQRATGRPRKHAAAQARQREASRSYRARQRSSKKGEILLV